MCVFLSSWSNLGRTQQGEGRLPGWLGETHTTSSSSSSSGGLLRGGGGGGGGGGTSTDSSFGGDEEDDGGGGGLPALNSIHVDPSRVTHLSWAPRAYLYRGFLRKAECDYIVEQAKPKMEKSTVVDNNTGKSVPSTIRTSDGMFFTREPDDIIADIERRIAEWTHIPLENGEGIQVLRYREGQKYEEHMDAFHDKFNVGEDKGGQRVATVLMYLSEPEQGGETVFPHTKERPHRNDPAWSSCAQEGVSVKARKGDALLFWSMDNVQNLDHKSTHAGREGPSFTRHTYKTRLNSSVFYRSQPMKSTYLSQVTP